MNTKSEIGEVNAQLRGELKEHGDMDYETISRSVGERDDALGELTETLGERDDALGELTETLELAGDETAHKPFGRSSTRNRVHADETNEGDLLIAKGDLVISIRQPKNTTVHIESRADSTTVNVSCFDSVEPQLLTPHSQPASKTSEENAVAKEKAQSGNGVKDRISGLMGKISIGLQTISSMITIWGASQSFPYGFWHVRRCLDLMPSPQISHTAPPKAL